MPRHGAERRGYRRALSHDGAEDATADVGEAMVAAFEAEGEELVIEAEEVEHGGVEIVDVARVLGGG